MQRYMLTFEFEGTNFSGWQRQPDVRTVEGVIEEAFAKLYQAEVNIFGQGRTDAGVHALAQTAHADLPDTYSKRRILHAMRGLLPEDIALKDITEREDKFHARFDAVSRTYRYQVITTPSPLHRRVVWYHYLKPDLKILNRCAGMVSGEHDFKNFCIPGENEQSTTICNISNSEWKREGEILYYEIEGNRFLRHMVRRLAGSMVRAATGKLGVSEFDRLLSGKKTDGKAFTAPAAGLILMKVSY